jgi:c-di-GMP-binding flagellar brake protein YcgR
MRNPRIHRRVKPHPAQPIEIQVLGNGFIEVLKARDISVGGIGIYVPHGFAGCDIDSELQIVVKLHGAKPFMTQARVRNLAKSGDSAFFGVEFTQLSRADHERIERYVAQRYDEGGVSDFAMAAGMR